MKSFITGIFKETFPGLEKALDLTWRRNEAITSNIANAETPGYRAADLNFGQELDRAFQGNTSPMLQTNSMHMDLSSDSGAHLTPDYSGVTKPDGNNVDLDIQMGQLAYNKGKYATAATLLRKKIGMISNAIRQVA